MPRLNNHKRIDMSSPLASVCLMLALTVLVVACAATDTKSSPLSPTATLQSMPTEGVVQQQAPLPGAITVRISLTEFHIASSIGTFQAGQRYYFIIMNKGHDIHEFMIMPDKPDGTPLSPDLQYKEMALEVEPIMPGTTWTVNFTFAPSLVGRAEFACQMGRHYQAGMRLPVVVTP
jgi:uncharacterized cupredoxin-like copper-binding protein